MFNGKFDNFEYLIKLGYNIKGDGENRSILMDACQFGLEEAVHILVEAGAPLDDTDYENWTPLSLASKGILYTDIDKAKRIVDYLWAKGARLM